TPAEDDAVADEISAAVLAQDSIADAAEITPDVAPPEEAPVEKPKRARRSRKAAEPAATAPDVEDAPARPRRRKTKAAEPTPEQALASAAELIEASSGSEAAPAPEDVPPAAAETSETSTSRRSKREIPE